MRQTLRVAIVTESFLPHVNGVTGSVQRVAEHLAAEGHQAIIIAPGARAGQEEIGDYAGFPVHRVPTVRVPGIDSFPVGVPTGMVARELRAFQPDVVHLASPFVLGAAGAFAAKALRVPAVAVYQTDVAGFATKYSLSPLVAATWEWLRTIHNNCALTLAPSTPTIDELELHGIRNVHRWGRGVDAERFNPAKRSDRLRAEWGVRPGQKIVGFVGRLAAEKGVHRLAALNDRDDLRIVIVGDGPERPLLEAQLPGALFTGQLGGDELAAAYASFDVFVHPGEFETFCQAIQEAHASGVPTVGPAAGGPLDLIQPGVNGELLAVDTFYEELPAAVDRCLGLDRATVRRKVEGRTWGNLGRQIVRYYADAIARDGAMRARSPKLVRRG